MKWQTHFINMSILHGLIGKFNETPVKNQIGWFVGWLVGKSCLDDTKIRNKTLKGLPLPPKMDQQWLHLSFCLKQRQNSQNILNNRFQDTRRIQQGAVAMRDEKQTTLPLWFPTLYSLIEFPGHGPRGGRQTKSNRLLDLRRVSWEFTKTEVATVVHSSRRLELQTGFLPNIHMNIGKHKCVRIRQGKDLKS